MKSISVNTPSSEELSYHFCQETCFHLELVKYLPAAVHIGLQASDNNCQTVVKSVVHRDWRCCTFSLQTVKSLPGLVQGIVGAAVTLQDGSLMGEICGETMLILFGDKYMFYLLLLRIKRGDIWMFDD